MIPKKPAPDLIRVGTGFRKKILRQRKKSPVQAPGSSGEVGG